MKKEWVLKYLIIQTKIEMFKFTNLKNLQYDTINTMEVIVTVPQIKQHYIDFLNYIKSMCSSDIKYFKTLHNKNTCFMHFKLLQNNRLHQYFFDGENNTIMKTNFHIKKLIHSSNQQINDFYLVGEIIYDMHQNKIFLVDDFVTIDYQKHNLLNLETRISNLSNFIENISTSSIDPFLFQIKIIYPHEIQMIDVFFKTILISMNTSMDGIYLMNENGNMIEFIECKNRVELDYEKLEQFIQSIPNITIVNHVEDLNDLNQTQSEEFKHKEEKVFYSVKDTCYPDIYYLFDSENDYKMNYNSKMKKIAMIPSLYLSEYMSIKNNFFYQKYYFHEYHQKWVPLITFP